MVRTFVISILTVLLSGCSLLGLKGMSSYSLKSYKELHLDNGLRVLVIPDKSLPRISMGLMVMTGSVYDPKNKGGVSYLTSELLSRGSRHKNATELAEDFAQLGTSFSNQVGGESTIFSVSSLSYHRDQLFTLFRETVLHPRFSQKEFKRVKKEMLGYIDKRSDNPSSFANLQFSRLIYGDHPAGHSTYGSRRSARSLKRKDVIRFYKRYYRPNNAIMFITGDFPSSFLKKVKDEMGQWRRRQAPLLKLKPVVQNKGLKIRLVHKPGLKQAQIRLGHLSIPREDQSYFSSRMAVSVLGGGFSSRLNQRIRDDLGLTYSIYSYLQSKKHWGLLGISTFTRNDKVGKVVSETLQLYKNMAKEGVRDKELKDNKALWTGQFPRQIETPESLAQNLLTLRLYEISDDYLQDYLYRVNRLRLSQVNFSIKKNFQPQNISVLVYADSAKVLKQLQKIGPVEVINTRY